MSVEFVEDLKRQWMAMIDSIDDPLVILDENFVILRQNLAYIRLAQARENRTIREFRGQKCFEVFAARKTPCSECLLKECKESNQPASWTAQNLVPNRQFEIRVHPLGPSEEEGSQARFVLHYRDITEQKRLQEGLAHADKMAALGKLASGVAHEINSPLAGILAFAQMALKEMNEDNPHVSDMREIQEAAKKCKAIVERLLDCARQEKISDTSVVDVAEAVRGTLRLAAPILRKNGIEFSSNIPHDPVLVVANSGKLGQVFLNLITNAIYSMKDCGGSLHVDFRISQENAIISVQDTGVGIDPAHLKRIFDPFFTTKPVGEGTGLGLSISYSIIKQYGGEISVQSALGMGATFSVSLPLSEN